VEEKRKRPNAEELNDCVVKEQNDFGVQKQKDCVAEE
jgi:hypothetical protein